MAQSEKDLQDLGLLLVQKELRQSSKSLIQFTQATLPKYQPAHHHHLIADALERVFKGECKRLMINMPPRHGKSQLASMHGPAFYVGNYPNKQIICCSYSDQMAKDFGREVRNIVDSEDFGMIFPGVSLASDSKSANRWNTNKGGCYIAAGISGGITGKGADVLIIDDPVKGRETAESELTPDKIWDWYRGDAFTRLMPGGAIIIIQTRWSDDDLSGRLLDAAEKGEGEQWEVLKLPAINDKNEALWPEWYDLESLERIKKVTGSRNWNALYQQNPVPVDGEFFKKEWFNWYPRNELPKKLKVYGASDYAVTADGGDYTEHGVFGVDENDDLYIIDWWYGQESSDIWIEELIRLAKKYKPLTWAEEAGQITKSLGPFIDKRQQETGVYFYRKPYGSSKDKPTRAQSFRGRAAQGKIFLPRNTAWADRLLHQLLRFPSGKHDDAVDVCSLLSRMLGELIKVPIDKPKQTGKFLDKMTVNELIKYWGNQRRKDEWD